MEQVRNRERLSVVLDKTRAQFRPQVNPDNICPALDLAVRKYLLDVHDADYPSLSAMDIMDIEDQFGSKEDELDVAGTKDRVTVLEIPPHRPNKIGTHLGLVLHLLNKGFAAFIVCDTEDIPQPGSVVMAFGR